MSRARSLVLVFSGLFAAATVVAQPPSLPVAPLEDAPVGPTGPYTTVVCPPKRPLRAKLHHTFSVIQDNFIGYPEEFVEPPVGFYVNQNFATMKAKADPHKFTLYKSDFIAGTTLFSPVGASRFNLMASRLSGWAGPITIEWSPDEPQLAVARRNAVVDYLQASRVPVIPERVVVGPSRYPGSYGQDAAGFYGNVTNRNQAAGAGFSLSPAQLGSFQSGGSN